MSQLTSVRPSSKGVHVFLASLAVTLAVPLDGYAQILAYEDINPLNADSDNVDPLRATGGRVNGIAIDPNDSDVIYAASEWGGIYKSSSSGILWSRLEGHLPQVTWDVAVDPSNSNRVYATSFHDGRIDAKSGINVSTDGGVTWTHPPTSVPPPGFCANPSDQTELTAFGITIDPSDPSNVFIGTSCGLAVSNDSGVTWTFTKPTALAGRMWDALSTNDGNFVDTCGDSGHWYLSVGTMQWSQGTGLPSGICSLAASPYTNINLFATVGTSIYETGDASSWTQTRTNLTPQGRIPFLATNERSTTNKFDLWFGDVSLFRVTCDSQLSPACGSGNSPSWSGPYTRSAGAHDDVGDIAFDPAAGSDACPMFLSSDGGIYVNLTTTSPGCHVPSWEQPLITPRALWPWTLSGAEVVGNDPEDIFFGTQDNGVFGSNNGGASSPTWSIDECCDGFDSAADPDGVGSVLYSVCCASLGRSTRIRLKNADFSGGGEINTYPPGVTPGFRYPDAFARWGTDKYVMITTAGVFITQDISAVPIVWTEIGAATEPPAGMCGVTVGTVGTVPVFYVQTGTSNDRCRADTSGDRVFRFAGTDPAGVWEEITLPQGGFGVFTVNQVNGFELMAAGFKGSRAYMYQSSTAGITWDALPELDQLMTGHGTFLESSNRGPTDFTGMNGYRQPSLVAISPWDSKMRVAGGRDSGLFLSRNGGLSWSLITDPDTSDTSSIPHLPRPRFAYFDKESNWIFVASQGKGIWRLQLPAACAQDIELANQTLFGDFKAAATITTGPNLTVNDNGSTTFEAGHQVVLGNGTSVVGDLSIKVGGTPICMP